ncbi:hypothetical protein ABH930_005832 [Kitasatospora sp. GAS204A]
MPDAVSASWKAPAVDSGAPSLRPFAYWHPASSSWRTYPLCADADSTPSPPTWPRVGTTSHGAAYEQATLEHPTAGIACSCWGYQPARLLVTPTASDSTGPNRTRPTGRGLNLRTQIALTLSPVETPAAPYRTPGPNPDTTGITAADCDVRGLGATVPVLLPTPLAGDGAKGSPGQKGSKGDLSLPSAIAAITNSPSKQKN